MFRTITFTISAVLAASAAQAIQVAAANLLTTTTNARVSHHPDRIVPVTSLGTHTAPEEAEAAPKAKAEADEEYVPYEIPEDEWNCANAW